MMKVDPVDLALTLYGPDMPPIDPVRELALVIDIAVRNKLWSSARWRKQIPKLIEAS